MNEAKNLIHKWHEVVGDTAIVQIREAYLGMIFVDSFSFLKKNDTWRIYTKLFHVET